MNLIEYAMPVVIKGKKFYRTQEALETIGISKATWFRWLREDKVADVGHKDRRGWRLFTDADIRRIQSFANTIISVSEKE